MPNVDMRIWNSYINSGVPATYLFPYVSRALANVRAGVSGDRKIALIGDSTTWGVGGVAGVGAAKDMADLLTAAGYPAAVGMNVPKHPPLTYHDTQWSAGTGWSQSATGFFTWGGLDTYYAGAVGAAANSLTFTPSSGYSCDSIDIWYVQQPAGGHFDAAIDGGSATTTATANATVAIKKVTITGSAATNHVINIGNITGLGPAYICGIEPWLSTTPKLRIANLGASGATTGTWTNTSQGAAGPLAALTAYAPDISIINLGINDAGTGVSTATFISNLATIASACSPSGDVVICSPVPSETGGTYLTNEEAYLQPTLELCGQSLNSGAAPFYGFLDIFDGFGGLNGWANLNPLRYHYDSLHPSAGVGYPTLAAIMASALLNV